MGDVPRALMTAAGAPGPASLLSALPAVALRLRCLTYSKPPASSSSSAPTDTPTATPITVARLPPLPLSLLLVGPAAPAEQTHVHPLNLAMCMRSLCRCM